MKVLIIIQLIFLRLAYSYLDNLITFDFLLKLIKPKINSIIDKSNIIDTKCARDLKTFVSDLSNFKLWAVKMLDASGKVHPGILSGNFYQIGNYEECLGIKEKQISAQYCSLYLVPNDNLTKSITSYLEIENVPKWRKSHQFLKHLKLALGICIPKSCSIKHLQSVWDYVEKSFKMPLHAIFEDRLCVYQGKPIEPYSIDVYIFFFFALIFVMVLASTVYDYFYCQYFKNEDSKPNIFVLFSLYSNMKRLLSTSTQSDNLTCLHGIKVLSVIWIILGHIVLIKLFMPLTNSIYLISEAKRNLSASFFMAAHFAVDTFFAISGILVVYVYSKSLEKSRIGLFSFYIYRILRLMPPLIATMLFYLSVFKHVGDGPIWPLVVKKISKSCHATWWATLFMFSNFIDMKYQCVEQAWYISVDTQLYILAPIIVYNINKYPKKIIIGILFTCLVSFIYTFSLVCINEFGYLLILETNENYMFYIYQSLIVRMPSWLIGTIFGYLIYQHSLKKMKISKNLNFLLWISSCSSMLGLILCHNIFAKGEYSVFRSALHNALAGPLWVLAICLIIYSCSMGHGGLFNTFLSHPVFVVCSKLVYSMFLVHVAVIFGVYGNQKTAGHFSFFEILFEFCGIFAIVLVSAVVLCLIFEMPVLVWMKQLSVNGAKRRLLEKGTKTNNKQDNTTWNFSISGKGDIVKQN